MIGRDQIEYAAVSDEGIRRAQNEDNQAVSLAVDDEQWQRQGDIFLVADGMGGHAVGELASDMASNLIPHTYRKNAAEGPALALRSAFLEANAGIHARGQQNQDFKGMGTTCTALVLGPSDAWIAHVGDSRAYRIRNQTIEQLTFDHSWVWELAKRQKVDPDSLKGIASNFINRSLGPDPLVEVDIEGPHNLQPGDVFVLCSDGLSNQLTNLEIGAIAQVLPAADACRILAQLANVRGGPDNITVVIVRVKGMPMSDAMAPQAKGQSPSPQKRAAAPLALLALFLGVAFAASAVVLSGSANSSWNVLAFTLAVICVGGGLVGLVRKYWAEQASPSGEFTPHALQVYRSAVCRIDSSLVTRMAQAEATLNSLMRARGAEVDWAKSQSHRQQGDQFLRTKDYPGALREYCHAIDALSMTEVKEVVKEEVHPVIWEKSTA